MNKILLFGAGKSATVLIDYLIEEAIPNNWTVIIADANREQIFVKTKNAPIVEAIQIDITDDIQRGLLIQQASIVISMMPPALHFLIAKDCLAFGKNLLTASYLDNSIKNLQHEIGNKGLLFLCEMGLDPGIDHMSAMKILDDTHLKGGTVISFKSHCGGLVAPESDNNPWHYKISWNPRNIVLAGKSGAEYKVNNKIYHKEYQELFNECTQVNISGLGQLAIYPNRDSLSYLPIYKMENVKTFLRTTLRHPSFCIGWDAIVKGGLTDDIVKILPAGLTFKTWSASIILLLNNSNKEMLDFLGLFEEELVPQTANTSADILQYLLETKLAMQPIDKDMIVMFHEIEYLKEGKIQKVESSLVVKGEDNLRTAMAKTVGLPLGIAAKLILNKTIQVTGVQIPTLPEIYNPVLKELEKQGVRFEERRF